VRVLNRADIGSAFIGATPLVLRQSGVEAPQKGAVVRLDIAGKAHVLG